MFRVCIRCFHVRASGFCAACHRTTEPFTRRGGDVMPELDAAVPGVD